MTQQDHIDSGLAADLAALDDLVARRRALGWLAGAGALVLLPGATTARAADGDGTCRAAPRETAGPFPADGTNRAPGGTSNALSASGIVRRDIRPNLVGAPGAAPGVLLDFTLTLVDAARCAPLANHAVYVWQSDAQGLYSLYTAPTASWLRGVQRSDARGQVRFSSIVPGCYDGRYPHIHVQIYPGLDAAMTGADALLTSQLVIPAAAARAAYADRGVYPGSAEALARFSLERDYVFRDNSPAELAAMTLRTMGDAERGFSGSATIALAGRG